jgi:hypothetical protein
MWHDLDGLKPWDPHIWLELKSQVDPIIQTCQTELMRRLGRAVQLQGCEINVMHPQSQIHEHSDAHASNTCLRVHVVISTNPDALITCGGDTRHFAQGQAFLFNNQRPHSVINGGSTDRAHLVIDLDVLA